MLAAISDRFTTIVRHLRGSGRLTEANIQTTLSNIRTTLLEADVALAVVDDFLSGVREQALGTKVANSLNPGQQFIQIVYQSLVELMGAAHAPLNLKRSPALVLACGLQGVGKTTNLAKIALHLKKRAKKRVLLAGCDVRRPAAIEQLAILAEQADLPCFASDEMRDATRRAKLAVVAAGQELYDVVLVDTAGRTTLDAEMMDEIRTLHRTLKPAETLFFIDAMQGQDAVATARAFADAVAVSGLVVTKLDGDSRGGSALSAKAVTGQPIKFIGTGEKLDDLESFHPDRFAARLLGMGDIASLAEQVEEKTDMRALQQFDKKMRSKPHAFDLTDQLAQFQQIRKMGGVGAIAAKLPGQMSGAIAANEGNHEKQIGRMEAIILSMTPGERKMPEIIKASRKRRIARGASVHVSHVNRLLANYAQTKKVLKKHAKSPAGMARMLQQLMG